MTRPRNDTAVRQAPTLYSDIEKVLYMINHVFLPSKLPQEDDFAPFLDAALADMVLNSLQEFSNQQNQSLAIGAVTSMTESFRSIHDQHGYITETGLQEALADLSKDGTSSCPTL